MSQPNERPVTRSHNTERDIVYERIDNSIRAGMITIVRETVDSVVDHILFCEETAADLPWRERSRLSVRFRLQGELGGTYSDAWSEVFMTPTPGGKVVRRTQHIRTHDGSRRYDKRVLSLCQDWEYDATQDLLDFFHRSRHEYAQLAKARAAIKAAACIRGFEYIPEPIRDPGLAACIAATRELRGHSGKRQKHQPVAYDADEAQTLLETNSESFTQIYKPLASYDG